MTGFTAENHGPVFAALLMPARLPPLGPGTPNASARAALEALSIETAFAHAQLDDREAARGCVAGVWLYHDFLDESHAISQELHSPDGSYWHALMHRREPDASNAAYWFRRVGDHPIFTTLAQETRALGLRLRSERWDPFDFVDLCEKQRGTGTEQETLLRQVQQREWELLFDWCFRRATGQG